MYGNRRITNFGSVRAKGVRRIVLVGGRTSLSMFGGVCKVSKRVRGSC